MHDQSALLCDVCPICQGGSIEDSIDVANIRSNVREFRDQTFTVWRCQSCQSLHCREPIDFDKYYANYPLTNQKVSYLTRVSYKKRLGILNRMGLRSTQSVLDFGCGAGIFVEYLKDRGHHKATGYDPYHGNFSDPDIISKRYEFVFSFGVIEHVACPRQFIQQQRRLVTDTGSVLIATPEARGLDLRNPDPLLLHQPYHRHILSVNALSQMAEAEGFEMVQTDNRIWLDTLHPGLNGRFVADYISATGGYVDALFERRQLGTFLRNPQLWFSFWLGYFFPRPGYLICLLKPKPV